MHCNRKTLALCTQQILLGDMAVREDQLIGGRTADTHLLLLRTEGKAGRTLLHDERRNLLLNPAALLNLAGHGDNDVYVSLFTVGNEALGTVQNPLVALQNSLCLLSLRIGSRTGLGQAECADLAAACQIGQILLLLILRTVGKDGINAQRGVCGNNYACGAADLGKLLHTHCIGQDITALSAILLGNGNTHEAIFCHLLNGLSGETLLLVNFLSKRLYFLFSEILKQLSRHLMFFG